MKLILEISGHEGETPAYRIVEDFPVTVGRGYHNDIILSDPHVGERHLQIDFDGSAWTLTDLGSVNPTWLNARPYRSTSAKLSPGDILAAGPVTLRVLLPDTPVLPALKMQGASSTLQALGKPLNVWALFILAVAAAVGWAYTNIWSEDMGLSLAAAGASALGTILIWSGLWSAGGRLARKKSFFMSHVALMSLFLFFSIVAFFIGTYTDFLSNENSIGTAVGYALNTSLLGLLLYGSLSLATTLKRRRRIIAAAFFSCGLMSGLFAVDTIAAQKFNPDALYPYRLEPFLASLAPAKSVDGFMVENADLFKSDTFGKKAVDEDKP